ncbi:amino acid adenylation domain protein [Coriobacterium glomerans PW2]|uniref:Amino acid adenylation domain protein n=1 Tax=Coriobacterium glomerans (strain ATCC 49209 / DSM 20642 / JCM 10262 / PW2) TaxID=700015 RepID=F2N790_CORGP|nr:amino acid adenylation domain-containing protein [Coriobacterium glomerans]AEB06565.1 amino acid adenylation domain protein [Coriobacterium glomerans PW2]
MVSSALTFLERSATRHADARAAVDENGSLTYAELLDRSRRVGSALLARDGAPRPVIVFMEKSIDALSTMLGALFSGSFYVPLDPTTPPERARAVFSTLSDCLVVVNERTRPSAESAFPAEAIEDVSALLAGRLDPRALDRAAAARLDTDPAYVLFTSGSTGTPKGVVVSHRALVDFITQFTSTFDLTCDDIIGNQAPFDFDVSVKDIYGSMAVGATLVMLPRRLFSEPAALIDALRAHRVTTMIWAAAALCLVSTLHGLDYAELPCVRRVMFSGEVMPLKHLRAWQSHLPQALFVNLYGPTEITCNCLYHVVDRTRSYDEGIPLGAPFANRRVLLLDENGRPVERADEVGELYVGGTSVALGYYGDEARTATAFIQNPLQSAYPEIVYRTGDLARRSADGELYFCGRADNQIKHQGHRIELEEIDAAFERQDGVERCRCAYNARFKQIHAFFEGDARAETLREAIAAYLPAPMVPTSISRVETMPLTKNGKVDRAALLEFARSARRAARSRERGGRAHAGRTDPAGALAGIANASNRSDHE